MNFLIEWSEFWTRENWLNIISAIRDFFNQPVPIIGCTVFSLCIFALTIISKTTIGKRSILKLKKTNEEMKQKLTDMVSSYEQFKTDVKNNETQARTFIDDSLLTGQAKLDEGIKLIEVIAENTHNQKVKNALLEYKEKMGEIKTDYDKVIDKKVQEKLTEEYRAKYDAKIADLIKRVESLTGIVNLLNKQNEKDVDVEVSDHE